MCVKRSTRPYGVGLSKSSAGRPIFWSAEGLIFRRRRIGRAADDTRPRAVYLGRRAPAPSASRPLQDRAGSVRHRSRRRTGAARGDRGLARSDHGTRAARPRGRGAADGLHRGRPETVSGRRGHRRGLAGECRCDRLEAAQLRELWHRMAVLDLRPHGLDLDAGVRDRRGRSGAADVRGGRNQRVAERRHLVHRGHARRDAARPPRRRRPGTARADRRAGTRSHRARGGGRRARADRPRAARRDRPSRLDDRPPGRSRAPRPRRRQCLDPRCPGDRRADRAQRPHRDAPPARHAPRRRDRATDATARAGRRAGARRAASRSRPSRRARGRGRPRASSRWASSCRPTGSCRRR